MFLNNKLLSLIKQKSPFPYMGFTISFGLSCELNPLTQWHWRFGLVFMDGWVWLNTLNFFLLFLFFIFFYFLIQDNFVWITTIFNPSNPIHALNSLTNILCILKLFSFILEFETYFTYVSYDSFWYSLRLTFDKFWNTLPNYVN